MRLSTPIIRLLAILPLLSTILPAPAYAAASSDDVSVAVVGDPNWPAAKKAYEAKDFATALPLLQAVAARNDDDADVFNYLGYTNSQLKNYEASKKAYGRALALEPEHRGANEYLGQLHLKLGELAAAEERLAVLDKACFFGCAEYDELKDAVAEFKRTGKYGGAKH